MEPWQSLICNYPRIRSWMRSWFSNISNTVIHFLRHTDRFMADSLGERSPYRKEQVSRNTFCSAKSFTSFVFWWLATEITSVEANFILISLIEMLFDFSKSHKCRPNVIWTLYRRRNNIVRTGVNNNHHMVDFNLAQKYLGCRPDWLIVNCPILCNRAKNVFWKNTFPYD